MSQSGTQTIASFTGTLLRREHQLGEKFVQLVFRENDKNWLCISTNTRLTRLDVGQNYRIRGLFKTRHGLSYIHEPRVTPAYPRLFHVKRWSVRVAIVLVVAAATAFTVRAVHGGLAPTSAESTYAAHKQTVQAPAAPAADSQVAAPAPAPAAPAATTSVITAKTTKKPTVTVPVQPAPAAPASVPDTTAANVSPPTDPQTVTEPDDGTGNTNPDAQSGSDPDVQQPAA